MLMGGRCFYYHLHMAKPRLGGQWVHTAKVEPGLVSCPHPGLSWSHRPILWTEPSAQCLRGAEPRRSGQVPPPPTAQAVTRVYPRAWWDLLRNNMLFSAGLQPGGTGSPCCPHEGRSCLTTEHTWQTARNEVTGLPCWSSG